MTAEINRVIGELTWAIGDAEIKPLEEKLGTLIPAEVETYDQEEWWHQVSTHLKLGGHIKLGLTPIDYVASLPAFTQPGNGEVEAGLRPILVDPRIKPGSYLEMSPIRGTTFMEEQWTDDPYGYTTPDAAYTTWGRFIDDITADEARQRIDHRTRVGTVYDGLAFALADQFSFPSTTILLPGSQGSYNMKDHVGAFVKGISLSGDRHRYLDGVRKDTRASALVCTR